MKGFPLRVVPTLFSLTSFLSLSLIPLLASLLLCGGFAGLLEDELARRFEQIPGVGTIELRGGVNKQIHIDLHRDRLQAAGLTPADVQTALAQENQKLPGGNVKEGVRDLYVRSMGEYTSVDQIGGTVIQYVGDNPVRVRDVATVEEGFEDMRRRVPDLTKIRECVGYESQVSLSELLERVVGFFKR